ncbi:NAD(P)/FAD-dependent oxidoreductase [Baekduia sp. Peel2402]|uniref:NAD(P)/FAD-dependent oxidoreductase n=1 Tax=Baekduia sp. Peel2402 TaxID=3458296 RepID=UPI00403EA18D
MVVGGGVVGVACALAFARREGVDVELREGRDALGLAASGTNSGILHTGFDSKPGELETELILRAAHLRPQILSTLGVPFEARGAVLTPRASSDHDTIAALAANARGNGVDISLSADGALHIPGEGMTDPVAFTLALAGAAVEHGARLALGAPVESAPDAEAVVNAAGLGAGRVARLFGDDSFDVHPRKGEFLVFDVAPPERILLPVPTARTKGVLVFPTLDGRTVAGPTAVDLDDEDWTVRPEARGEILDKAVAMYPALEGAEPSFAYAGLRPAGRDGANYVVRRSETDERLIHAAAIRSTGLTAAVAIAERVVALAGLEDRPQEPLRRGVPWVRSEVLWWRRTADKLAAA